MLYESDLGQVEDICNCTVLSDIAAKAVERLISYYKLAKAKRTKAYSKIMVICNEVRGTCWCQHGYSCTCMMDQVSMVTLLQPVKRKIKRNVQVSAGCPHRHVLRKVADFISYLQQPPWHQFGSDYNRDTFDSCDQQFCNALHGAQPHQQQKSIL